MNMLPIVEEILVEKYFRGVLNPILLDRKPVDPSSSVNIRNEVRIGLNTWHLVHCRFELHFCLRFGGLMNAHNIFPNLQNELEFHEQSLHDVINNKPIFFNVSRRQVINLTFHHFFENISRLEVL